MSSILTELGHISIINSESVIRLKGYIAQKRPEASVARRAAILADALNKALDSRLPKFEVTLYSKLKRLLLEQAAKRPSFEISCSDVFQMAIEMNEDGEAFFTELSDWLSISLDRKIAKNQLAEVVLQTREILALKPELDMPDAIAAAEAEVVTRAEQEAVTETAAAGESFTKVIEETFEVASAETLEEIAAIGNEAALEPYEILGHFDRVFKKNRPAFRFRSFLDDRRRLTVAAFAAVVLFAGVVAGIGRIAGDISLRSELLAESKDLNDSRFAQIASDEGEANKNSSDSSVIKMRATAYDLSFASCGKNRGDPGYGITTSGAKAKVGRTVAVDPAVIPLGSRLMITFPEEYSHLDGIYMAEDTGRLIKGSSIDIFFGEDKAGSTDINKKAMDFGVREVTVEILEEIQTAESSG